MINIAIVDDEAAFLNETQKYVENYLSKNKIPHRIFVYKKGNLLLYDLQDGYYFDIFILDIQMPYLNGMELAKEIGKNLIMPLIIFLTSYEKYAMEAFELSVFRYIAKNNLELKLSEALNSAIKKIEAESKECYIINSRSRFEKIPVKHIIYLYKEDKNTIFVTSTGTTQERKSLYKVREKLDPREFILIDRGYIVNIIHIVKVIGHDAVMSNGSKVSISRGNLQGTKKSISDFWKAKLISDKKV